MNTFKKGDKAKLRHGDSYDVWSSLVADLQMDLQDRSISGKTFDELDAHVRNNGVWEIYEVEEGGGFGLKIPGSHTKLGYSFHADQLQKA